MASFYTACLRYNEKLWNNNILHHRNSNKALICGKAVKNISEAGRLARYMAGETHIHTHPPHTHTYWCSDVAVVRALCYQHPDCGFKPRSYLYSWCVSLGSGPSVICPTVNNLMCVFYIGCLLFRISTVEETTFHLLHLSLMREYIDFEFACLKVSFL